jgi:hypothetical protein
MAFLSWIVDALRWLVALVLPFFAKARDFQGMGPALRWAIHILLVAAILIGLFYVQHLDFLRPHLVGPRFISTELWLPLLFVLVYALGWLGWWIWRLLQPEVTSHFPDIDAAWDEALASLHQQGIDLTEVPLFLVLGRPAGGEDALFQATQLSLNVRGSPARPDAPLHVYASHDAIYVTCAGASLMGRQAAILAEDPEFGGDGGHDGGPAVSGRPFDPGVSIGAKSIGIHSVGVAFEGMEEMRAILRQAEREGRTTTEAEKQRIEQLMGGGRGGTAVRPRRARPQLLRNTEEAHRHTARFEHLCRLIVRDRSPYCSINGILLLVPYAATESDEDATQTADICQRELASARQALHVYCPVFGLLSDLEKARGFPELIECFPKDQRQRRIGQHFPLVPDLDPAKTARMIEQSARWICTSLLPTLIYKFLHLEANGRETSTEASRANYRLIDLMSQLRGRERRLGLILARAVEVEDGAPALFGGCYLGASGPDHLREQAFISGVFRRLIDNQSYISWTRQALQDEEQFQRWTSYGYLALAGFVAVAAGIVALVWWKSQ